MKKNLALLIGLTLAASAFTVSAQQAPEAAPSPKAPATPPCVLGQSGGAGRNCPYYGYGQCQGQQKRHGWGQGQGQGQGQQKRHGWGQGQGKGFRGGPRDGTGPRRDGSGGQCPWQF